MTLSCDWFVLAGQVICDRLTNQLTILNVLDGVSALTFPAQHPNFAFAARYRWVGELPTTPQPVAYRLVRESEGRAPQTVCELSGEWSNTSRIGRVYQNFKVLRLFQPETIVFRLDHRVGEGPWEEGARSTVEVKRLTLSDEERGQLVAQMAELGLTAEGLDG
ncbi:hypothetical protein L6R49_12390 [Myxococcota bacterium]|nr:hypothetical protein [Myxococcota bacterium]